MNIYTSYFNNPIKLDASKTMYVSIARYSPSWFECPVYLKLAPPPELLHYYKNNIKDSSKDVRQLISEYINYYVTKVLDNLDPVDVINELVTMAENRGKENIVMLCYEKSSDFCHRHIVSSWLRHGGFNCIELTSEVSLS